MFLGKII